MFLSNQGTQSAFVGLTLGRGRQKFWEFLSGMAYPSINLSADASGKVSRDIEYWTLTFGDYLCAAPFQEHDLAKRMPGVSVQHATQNMGQTMVAESTQMVRRRCYNC